MSSPEVNIPLLRKAVEWAEAEAAKPIELCEWEQTDWVATAEKRARLNPASDWPSVQRLANKAPECGTCYCIAGYVDQAILGNEEIHIGSRVEIAAAGALGLDPLDASDLFHPSNTIADVRRIAESIAGESL